MNKYFFQLMGFLLHFFMYEPHKYENNVIQAFVPEMLLLDRNFQKFEDKFVSATQKSFRYQFQ